MSVTRWTPIMLQTLWCREHGVTCTTEADRVRCRRLMRQIVEQSLQTERLQHSMVECGPGVKRGMN